MGKTNGEIWIIERELDLVSSGNILTVVIVTVNEASFLWTMSGSCK